MSDIKNLYQQVIVDHNRSPRNFGKIAHATQVIEGINPLCGDRLTLYLDIADGRICNIRFSGTGCAISIASASLMTDLVKNKMLAESEALFQCFHNMLFAEEGQIDAGDLGKLIALAGVRDYPSRVKCATLCWHALHSALTGDRASVSTE